MAPRTLVVKNLSEDVTEDDLRELFSKEGPVYRVDFESSTCGVVKFCDTNHAKEAMNKLNMTILKGKPMIITCPEKYGMKFLVSKYNDCKDLCVEFHPKDLVGNKSKFESMFTMYGKCTFDIETDENCKPTGIGFVSYGTSEEAKEATNLNAVYLGSHPLYVSSIVTEDEVRIFVIEDNRRQLVETVNMRDFPNISDLLQHLNKLWATHKQTGLLERISLDSPWPGYDVVYTHVGTKSDVVIKPWEYVESFFNEDPNEHSKLWFLGFVNKIEFYEK